MAEKYSITIQFDTANAMADWLQHHTYPTNSNANVNPTTGEVGGSASANANPADPGDPWADSGFDASPTNPVTHNNGPTTVILDTQKGQQKWTFNSTNAPMCGCGNPAAYQEGATNNKPWKRWTCAKSAPDGSDNWKNKCDFSEFVGGRGKK